jgi:hypothetical protein
MAIPLILYLVTAAAFADPVADAQHDYSVVRISAPPQVVRAVETELERYGTNQAALIGRLDIYANATREHYTAALKEIHPVARGAIGAHCRESGDRVVTRTNCYGQAVELMADDLDQLQAGRRGGRSHTALLSEMTRVDHFAARIVRGACGAQPSESCFDENIGGLRGQILAARRRMRQASTSITKWSLLVHACNERFPGGGPGQDHPCLRARNWTGMMMPRAAGIPYEPSGRLPGSIDPLFDANTRIVGGNDIQCPDFIPREFCGPGGRYDPHRYVARREQTGTRHGRGGEVPVYGTVYRYDPSADVDLGNVSIGRYAEGVFDSVKPEFENDVGQFLSELYMESYLQLALVTGPTGDFAAKRDRLREAAACLGDGGRAAVDRLAAALPPAGDPGLAAARAEYRENMARAAQAMKVVRDRWAAVRDELGMDDVIARPLLTDAEFSRMPPVAASLARGVTGLPILRHFTREVPFMVGATESAARRPCDFFRLRADPTIELERGEVRQRRDYCMNLYGEYVALTHEMDQLHNRYRLLGEEVGGRTGYERVAAAAPIDPRVQGYNLDLNRRSPRELLRDDGEGFRLSMHRLTNPPSPPAPATLAAVDQLVRDARDRQLDSFLQQIGNICRDKPKTARQAVENQRFMELYFDCDRTRFSLVSALMEGHGRYQAPPAAEGDTCRDRRNSAWVACRLFRDVRESRDLRQVGAQAFQMAMDGLFFVAPGIGGLRLSAGSIAAGAVVGGGMGYVLAPSTEELREAEQARAARSRAGYGTYSELQEANRELRRLAEHDPEIEAMLDGAVMGGVFGAMAGGRGRPARLTLQEGEAAEAALARLYTRLERDGKFSGPRGARAQASLQRLFRKAIERRDPMLLRKIAARFPSEMADAVEIIRILERRGLTPRQIRDHFERLARDCG